MSLMKVKLEYLYFVVLVLDDGGVLPEGGLELLVPLEEGLPEFGRQLQVCNRATLSVGPPIHHLFTIKTHFNWEEILGNTNH